MLKLSISKNFFNEKVSLDTLELKCPNHSVSEFLSTQSSTGLDWDCLSQETPLEEYFSSALSHTSAHPRTSWDEKEVTPCRVTRTVTSVPGTTSGKVWSTTQSVRVLLYEGVYQRYWFLPVTGTGRGQDHYVKKPPEPGSRPPGER